MNCCVLQKIILQQLDIFRKGKIKSEISKSKLQTLEAFLNLKYTRSFTCPGKFSCDKGIQLYYYFIFLFKVSWLRTLTATTCGRVTGERGDEWVNWKLYLYNQLGSLLFSNSSWFFSSLSSALIAWGGEGKYSSCRIYSGFVWSHYSGGNNRKRKAPPWFFFSLSLGIFTYNSVSSWLS